MSQYLGDISAYALAVSQGYTGTEEEYAELMASYATVGQTAVTAAQTATTKASEAATSATTATNKASEATTAATTATNKAAEAQADADAAALDASQALSAASTATTKASEATTAAATAVSAKDDAVSANTAAQSAKTAAQTAQTGAETAAASVSASAAQIATNAEDISQLKSDLTTITGNAEVNGWSENHKYIKCDYAIGTTVSTTPTTTTSTVRYQIIPCNSGDSFTITTTGAGGSRAYAFLDSQNVLIENAPANATLTQRVITAPTDAAYLIVNDTTLNGQVFTGVITSKLLGIINDIESNVDKVEDALSLVVSKNCFDKENATLTTINGTPVLVSPKVSVSAGETYYSSYNQSDPNALVNNPYYMLYLYDANGNMTSTSTWVSSSYTIPSGVVAVQFIIAQTTAQYILVEKGERTNVYEDYFAPYYTAVDEGGRELIDSISNHAEIILPRRLVGVIGTELNLYKSNCVLYGNEKSMVSMKYIDYISGYYEDDNRYRCLPTSESTSVPQFSIFDYDLKTRTAFKNLELKIVDPSNLSGQSIKAIVIGDSKVAGVRIVKEFADDLVNAGVDLTLLGTIATTWQYGGGKTIYHEGRSGWSSSDYMSASKDGVTNPFYNDGGFDFSNYMSANSFTDVDYVFINLGTNDYGDQSGLGSFAYIDTFVQNINTMIASIHDFDANIKIVVGLCEGVCTLQWSSGADTPGYNYNTRAKMLNKASIAAWDTSAMQSANVFVCPLYLSMDMNADYNMQDVPLSARDEHFNTGKTRYKVLDTVHQSEVGYGKNADYMYAVLCYAQSL